MFLHITCRLVNLLAAERAMDTVVWQMLASVAIPGYTIHTVVAIAHSVLTQVPAATVACGTSLVFFSPSSDVTAASREYSCHRMEKLLANIFTTIMICCSWRLQSSYIRQSPRRHLALA